MDKKICKELRLVEKRLSIPLGKDLHNYILGFLLPASVGDIWSGGTWSGRDVGHVMVTRCSPDKVWLKHVVWDRDNSPRTNPKWIDHPNPTRHKPGKCTRRTISFDTVRGGLKWDSDFRRWIPRDEYEDLSVTMGCCVYRPGLRWGR